MTLPLISIKMGVLQFRALKDKGIVDSGCSMHMTGNKAHLADYQEFKGGSVAFGGSNGRITGKGKIKAGKLDFEDVYYVEELKHYNLFSMSQICDKKNKILFTDTDCLVMSPDFKLPDENSKAFRVYNLETKRVEENLHVNFLENKPNVVGKGHAWMFDLDYLTNSMNYEPVLVENQANKSAGLKGANNSAGTQANDDQGDKIEKTTDVKTCEKPVSQVEQIFLEELEKLKRQEKEANVAARKETAHENKDADTTRTNLINTISTPLSDAGPSRAFNDGELLYPDDPSMPHLEDIYASPSEGIFIDSSYDDEGIFECWSSHHTTNGHQFTMSNPHQELASPEANDFCKELASLKQTALGKDKSNPFMAGVNTPRCDEDSLKLMVVVFEDVIRKDLRLDDADGVKCLPNEKIFTKLARMGYEKPPPKLTFYKYTSPALTQNVFVNMRRVGKGFFRVETPLFATMLVQPQPPCVEEEDEQEEVPNAPTPPSPTIEPTPPPQDSITIPPQAQPASSLSPP
nr:ribonuclease H-like domain-containing protein [Tanacetum cinerariifolium]